MKKIIITLNILASLSCIALATKYIAVPYIAEVVYREDYKKLVFACDNVMRDHLIAKNRVNVDKSEDSIKQLHSAEVGLLTCDDYDKLRKRMMILGVNEENLAMIGIEAIEEKSNDVRNFVKTHEIRY
jgi:hypothetical protein